MTVGLPDGGAPPFPVVLSPIVPDAELLRRGIGVVRWKTHWEVLSELAPEPSPSPAPSTAEEDTSVGAWILRSPRPGVIGRAYFQLITTEAHKSVPAVLDYLQTQPEVDSSRVAITGSSTGGFTALQALAEDPRLHAGVIQVACGDYRAFLRSSRLGLDDDERWLVDGEMVLDDDYGAVLDAIAPANRADRFPPRPLLVLSGAEDRAIPAACVRSTVAKLRKTYERAGVRNEITWVEFADLGHNMGPTAAARTLEFLERELSPSTAPVPPSDAASPS